MSNLSTLPKGDSAWLLRKAIERIIQQVSVLETNIGSSTTGNSANTQIIFNDNGTLRGDAGLTYNKTTDLLTVGAATITGDLTVDTSTLKVDSANNRVGIGTASPGALIEAYTNTNGQNRVFINNPSTGSSAYNSIDFTGGTAGNQILSMGSGYSGSFPYTTGALVLRSGQVNGMVLSTGGSAAPIVFGINDSEAMRLNSTGLGVGGSPTRKLSIVGSGNTYANINSGDNTSLVGVLFGGTSAPSNGQIIYNNTDNSMGLHTAGAVKLTIDSSGNVGIGVTPANWATIKALQVGSGASLYGYTATEATLSGNTYYNAGFKYVANGQATQYQQQVGEHRWFTAPSGTAGNAISFTQAMTLDASGNLLVGTTSASNQERLNVSSALSLYVARVFNTASSGGNYGIQIRYSNAAPNNATNEFLACSDNVASRAFIYANGGLANYQANDSNLSDARTKTDIKPLASYWNKIKSLEVVTFKYKDQTHSDDNIGLIAQQVESVAPEFVSNEGFGEVPEDGVPLKTIYTTDLYHAAIKALQEAMTRIEALEAKLA